MSEEKKMGATFAGITSTNLYEVSYEDKKNPSENGLGFSTMICATDEETARKWFAIAEPDCEIKEVVEREGVLMPLFEIEDPLNRRLNEYQKAAMGTRMETSNNDAYMLLNLVGEVGELCSKIAKGIRKGKMNFVGNDLQLADELQENEEGAKLCEELAKEVGDVLWQTAGTADNLLGMPLGMVAQMNLEKLAIRQMEGTIAGDGDGSHKGEGRTE